MNTNEIITSSVLAYAKERLNGLKTLKEFLGGGGANLVTIDVRIEEVESIITLCEGLEQQLSLMKENIEKVLNHTGELK